MPDPVQMLALGLTQVTQAKARQQLVQYQTVQVVDQRPSQLTRHHAAHGWLVAGPPGQREGIAVDPGVQRLHLVCHAAVPVDHRAKDIKGQHPRCVRGVVRHGGLSVVELASNQRRIQAWNSAGWSSITQWPALKAWTALPGRDATWASQVGEWNMKGLRWPYR